MNSKIQQPAGNFYDKYRTRNPFARALMNGFLRAFDDLARMVGTTGSALEIGCGEGELSMRLARAGWQVQGCDIADDAVTEARKRIAAAGLQIPVEKRDIATCGETCSQHDLVVCCEVLEHLQDTQSALETLKNLSKEYVLVSVPCEPVWRVLNMARGRYLSAWGNTPGHIQHWSRRGFLQLLSVHLDVVAVRSPLPWTMALCRARKD